QARVHPQEGQCAVDCRSCAACDRALGHQQGHAVPRLVDSAADGWRGSADFGRFGCLVQQVCVVEQGHGVGWADKLSALSMALAAAFIRQYHQRECAFELVDCLCGGPGDVICMVDVFVD